MRTFIRRLVRDDEGQELVEYVLLIALIALAVAIAFPPLTDAITGVFNTVRTRLNTASGT
jgi:Flp pilus assembly pilin Flp